MRAMLYDTRDRRLKMRSFIVNQFDVESRRISQGKRKCLKGLF